MQNALIDVAVSVYELKNGPSARIALSGWNLP